MRRHIQNVDEINSRSIHFETSRQARDAGAWTAGQSVLFVVVADVVNVVVVCDTDI